MNCCARFLTVGLLLGVWPSGRAEDWTEFRGATGQGVSGAVGLPVEWGAKKQVVWKVVVPGSGWSSPVVAGERIYLTSAVPKGSERPGADRELGVMALDAADGKVVWQKTLFVQKDSEAPKIHQKNSHASPTPIIEAGRVYAHFGHMGTACVDAESGDVIWMTREHGYAPVHGNGGSPVIAGDLLIFNADAAQDPAVIALEKETGKLRWKVKRESEAKRKFSFCTPLLIEVGGVKQLITPGSGVVQALNPETGEEIWRVGYDQGYSVVPRPVFAEGLLYVCTGYDKPGLLAIRVDGEAKGDVTKSHLAWRLDKFVPHNPSPVVVGGELYCLADNGVLSCVDAKSGKVHYQERCTGPASSSILAADGKLFLLDERGQGCVVEAGTRFKLLATNAMDERCLASYAVVGKDLLLRTAEHLYRLGGGK